MNRQWKKTSWQVHQRTSTRQSSLWVLCLGSSGNPNGFKNNYKNMWKITMKQSRLDRWRQATLIMVLSLSLESASSAPNCSEHPLCDPERTYSRRTRSSRTPPRTPQRPLSKHCTSWLPASAGKRLSAGRRRGTCRSDACDLFWSIPKLSALFLKTTKEKKSSVVWKEHDDALTLFSILDESHIPDIIKEPKLLPN